MRAGEGETVLVMVRFGRRGGVVQLPQGPATAGGWAVLLTTHGGAGAPEDGRLPLRWFEGVVLRALGRRR